MKRAQNSPKRRRRITEGATGLKRLRERLGYSQPEVADALNTSKSVISDHESNPHRVDWGWAQRYAKFYNVNPAYVMFGGEPPKVAVAGYVGAGAEVIPFDDFSKGAGLSQVRCPENLNPGGTVAVQVRGDSMSPGIENGWILYYSREPEADAAAAIGRLCIVRLEDGRSMVKHVRQGPRPGLFNLLSVNAPLIEGIKLEWASPVRAMLAPTEADADIADIEPVENIDDDLLIEIQREVDANLQRQGIALAQNKRDEIVSDIYDRVRAGIVRGAERSTRSKPIPKTLNGPTPKHKVTKRV